jgi:Pyridoxamine 5'-phosphate oxidase
VSQQGDVALLGDPVAQELLESAIPARLAYTWTDGSPRVVPINFRWTGEYLVMGSPPKAPKLKALAANPRVAVTIDANSWPYKVLLVRGAATVEMRDDVDPDYALAAERYLGVEAGRTWVEGLRGKPMARIEVTPDWVAVLDFETRFPSALSM